MRFRKQSSPAEGGFEPFANAGGADHGSTQRRGSGDARKARQLCSQVRELLALVLAEHCADPVLERVSIHDVTPAPDAGRLLVTVGVDAEGGPFDAGEVLEAMRALRGRLRREIAAEVHRKKTPELVFEVLPSEALTEP